jgi:hypothetical protein
MLQREQRLLLHGARIRMIRPAALSAHEANPLNKHDDGTPKGHGRINSSPIPSLLRCDRVRFREDQVTDNNEREGSFS